MGGGAEKRAIKKQADAQARIAQTQERLGGKFIEQGDADRAREEGLFAKILPYAESLLKIFKPGEYETLERPDVTGTIRRDYADDLADIEQSKNRELANAEGYYTSSGLSRSGARGSGLAGIVRGSLADRGGARRNMQRRLTEEDLAGYYDKLNQRGEKASLGLQGINVLRGQQAVFNPSRGYGFGSGNLGSAAGTRGSAAGTYERSARLPSVWSKIGGVAGAGLGLANPATAAGGGLRSLGRMARRNPG